ncbi:hypothetical protein F4859DRAFT_473252, partial [Xylaria cf. heliscus]
FFFFFFSKVRISFLCMVPASLALGDVVFEALSWACLDGDDPDAHTTTSGLHTSAGEYSRGLLEERTSIRYLHMLHGLL